MEGTDRELWDRANEGDADAFAVIFHRHARAVYNYCFRRSADWSVAEDLVSVVFLEAWRRRGDVRLMNDSALPWLLGVATNVVRNEQRSRRRYRKALDRVGPERDQADFADDALGRMSDEREMHEVVVAINRLPRREREVLALCAFAGLEYAEAAVALGLPIGTVRSRLSRARASLRTTLGDADEEVVAPA